ncbi:MAG: (d)CMP kinase [Methanosarcina thermophila]|jgi:cytidylate kinase|uniref:Cytidylate kinase n=3 Tax=Methanosarcina thermophila TaxID=2210 RepID=A0A1I6XR89_METTE|nr:AAA family ATPase [Methanosarcina thermophila]ALK05658.1 MAG: cytidylate kinase [Methanosarcina sp. 795]AKB12896.1 Cytidylate kinase [Methanosarcina thermophila TM-1]AKB16483.1 Cytidylate kinase [Methanosarcina thermophila CHTI-55]NLU56924.1 AAA family ATPase [Methanosarcina thermophila]SFT40572.1 cytidylate kinase [Methanosarcina thermophila]
MRITVSGLPGSGTTTISRLLAEYYELELISSGEVFRKIAKEKGISLAEFGAMAEKDPSIDLAIDKNQRAVIHSQENLILESRLAGHMAKDVPNVLKIWIKAPLHVRVKRILKREKASSFDEELKKTVEREKSEALRYMNYYNIDISDLSIYDIIIDSEKWNQYQIFDILRTAIDSLMGPE